MELQSENTQHCGTFRITSQKSSYRKYLDSEKQLVNTGEKVECEICKKHILPKIMGTI